MKYLVTLFLLLPLIAWTQSSRTIRVKAGDDVAQAYSQNGFYRFPSFVDAIVYFKGGGLNKGTLFNYNYLSGNLQFIGPRGDTLEMGGASSIDSVVFPATTLVYSDGFMELVEQADSLHLLKKLSLKTQVENVGAYGMPNTTSSITNIKSISSGTGVYNLILNQDLVITELTSWFMQYGGNPPVKISKDNLLKTLSSPAVEKAGAYLKQNRTNFDRENDLRKLFAAIRS